jgi:hypothetical protein
MKTGAEYLPTAGGELFLRPSGRKGCRALAIAG